MKVLENPFLTESRSILERYHGEVRLLGSGDESCVFTDDKKVYKIFNSEQRYYEYLGRQFSGRFSGRRHLFDIQYEVIDGLTVFIYDYEPSISYSGGFEDELIDTMAEFALCGVVCSDIKPNNFRITENGLRFIDYGHSIRPFTESGFVNMCLNTFLCLKYWPEPQFIRFSQIIRYTWDKERTDGFIGFFNKAHNLYLERKGGTRPPTMKVPDNLWIERMIIDHLDATVYCLSDLSEQLFDHPVSSVKDIEEDKSAIIISKTIDSDIIVKIKKCLGNGHSVYLITDNPFFRDGFVKMKNRLESEGLFIDILAHSDPHPCEGGLESDMILLELADRPFDNDKSAPSKRNEEYVFVICGRNVSPQCYLRCWHSLETQRCGRWGAVIIDDASDDEDIDYLIKSTAGRRKRVTYIRNENRRSILPNIVHSIKDICSNPNSVIITLDMDDALLNDDVLCTIRSEYMRGHDVVSSTCLKKGVGILPYEIRYDDVRGEKVGDVWMHLRSFRKYLFDQIDESDFKENGEWIEIFNELTFMVPIAEMARNPIQIKAPLYLWEPRTVDDDVHRVADEHTKTLMRSRKPYLRYDVPRIVGEIRPPGILVSDISKGDILIIRHAEKEDRKDYISTERGITKRGERESELFGSCLEHIDTYICSEIRRTAETAYCMNKGNGGDFDIIIDPALNALRYDYSIWCDLKAKYGYLGVLSKWKNGEFTNGELPDFKEYSIMMLEKFLELSDNKTICVVTHDHMICVLSTIFTDCKDAHVPFLGGFILKKSEILAKIDELKTI